MISSQQPAAIIAAGDVLGEGPVWDAHAGRLLWTDIQSRRLRAFDPASGAVDTYAARERIASIALQPDEARAVIAAFETGLGLFDLASGQVEWLHRVEAEANGRRFNDGRVDRAGRFWAGTMVEDEAIRTPILSRIQAEHSAALASLRDITGTSLGLRFPKMQARCEDLRPQLDRLNRLQIDLLRQSRQGTGGTTVPLMQSMTCIASGLGWTG